VNVLKGVEALLYVSDSPAKPEDLARALQVPVFEVEDALEKLGGRYQHGHGIQIVRIAGGYQISTKPDLADAVTRFLQPKRQKLSRTLLEVLAIVAYQQPVTTAEIDAVRGVASDYSVRQLLEKRLIYESGRKQAPGRPILYSTTPQFLHAFHMNSVQELPQLAVVGAEQPPEQPTLPAVVEEVDS
jgi:segregation and condensation protein B